MPLFGPPNIEKLKAKRDVKGLIKALSYQKDSEIRRAATEALGELGDMQAVEALTAALKDSDSRVVKSAKEVLVRLERYIEAERTKIPSLITEAAKQAWKSSLEAEWDLVNIGAPAVDPLIAELTSSKHNVRRAAARVLVRLYKTGQLSQADTQKILQQRAAIMKKHEDERAHDDTPACVTGEHTDVWGKHSDNGGIGEEFPL